MHLLRHAQSLNQNIGSQELDRSNMRWKLSGAAVYDYNTSLKCSQMQIRASWMHAHVALIIKGLERLRVLVCDLHCFRKARQKNLAMSKVAYLPPVK
jgi:hypothetical protein